MTTEFEKTLPIERLDADPTHVRLAAGDDDLAALADDLSVPGVLALSAEAAVTRHGPLIDIRGRVTATLRRQCVVSLEAMTEEIDEAFSVQLTTAPQPKKTAEEMEADLDAPDPVEGDAIEMRHIFVEQVVLAMAPHPRIEGAEPPQDPGAGASISPFSVLADLKRDQD